MTDRRPRLRRAPGSASLFLAVLAGTGVSHSAAAPEGPIVEQIAPVVMVPPPGRPTSEPVLEPARLRRMLAPVIGLPCDPHDAAERIARPYRFLGYVPSVDAACEGQTLRVRVRESSHTLDLITFDPAELEQIGAAPGSGPPERLYPVPEDAPRGLLRGLIGARPGDLYNHTRYRADRDVLVRFGYTIAFVGGAASGDGWRRGAYLVQSLAPRSRQEGGDAREQNYVGGTAAYGPTYGGSAGVIYQREGLFGTLDALTVAPSYNASWGGNLTYRAPLLVRRETPANLCDLQVGVFSNFTNDRSLDGITTDERRTGYSLTLGIRPLGLHGPHALSFSLGARHERTDLDPPVPGTAVEALTALRFGSTWEWRHQDRSPSFTLRVEPAIDVALEGAGGTQRFLRPSLDGWFHSRHGSGIESEFHLLAGSVDRDVPSYELWSLGGARTVRGFPEDFRLGRRVAALQAELWIPLLPDPDVAAGRAGVDPGTATYSPRAARLFKAALFADGGLIGEVPGGGEDRAVAGAGIGIRLRPPRQPLVIRLDYGWGLGGRGDDTHFYAGITYGF